MAHLWLLASAFTPESGWTPVLKLQDCLRAAAWCLGLVQLVMSSEHVWMILYLLPCTFIGFTSEKISESISCHKTKTVDNILLNTLLQEIES